jgi:hypothetical protein
MPTPAIMATAMRFERHVPGERAGASSHLLDPSGAKHNTSLPRLFDFGQKGKVGGSA